MSALLRDRFVRNIGVLTGGTALAQGIVVLSMPILTRLYTPEQFALLAVYMAVLSLVTVVSCLRYNIAISLPESDEDGAALVVLSVAAAFAVSVLLGVMAIALPSQTSALLGQPGFRPYLWLVPLGVLLSSVYTALQYWTSRKHRFRQITQTRVTRAVAGSGVQISGGILHSSPFGLLFGHLVYNSMGIAGLALSMFRKDGRAFSGVRLATIRRMASDYRRFPIYSVPESLLNTAGIQIPILILASALAGPEAGYLMLAMRVLGLPMGLIGNSVAQVYLAEAGAKLRAGDLGRFTRGAMLSLAKVGAPPLIAVGVTSPFLFPIVFGPEWQPAGWMLAWMTPWFLLQFVSSPISMLLHVTGHQRTAVALQAAGCILRIGAVLAATQVHSDLAVAAYFLSSTVFYGLYIGVLLVVSHRAEVPVPRS